MNTKENLIRDITSLTPFDLSMSKLSKEVATMFKNGYLSKDDLVEIREVIEDCISVEGYTNKYGLRSEKIVNHRLNQYDEKLKLYTDTSWFAQSVALIDRFFNIPELISDVKDMYKGNKEGYRAINKLTKLIRNRSTVMKFGEDEFYIDNEMVDLVKHLNAIEGVETVYCCYGHTKSVPYIDIKGSYLIDCEGLNVSVRLLKEDIGKYMGCSHITRIKANFVLNDVGRWLEEFMLFRGKVLSLKKEYFKEIK